ncbi:hypothetical protein EDC01DRAFT_645654 [Geopyxis carbonaria]|nr:hypothetical protein EDC01DRAFT_645654 [Geopyxis carbonaria]
MSGPQRICPFCAVLIVGIFKSSEGWIEDFNAVRTVSATDTTRFFVGPGNCQSPGNQFLSSKFTCAVGRNTTASEEFHTYDSRQAYPDREAVGYPYHVVCWELLKVVYGRPISPDVLFDIFYSFPDRGTTLWTVDGWVPQIGNLREYFDNTETPWNCQKIVKHFSTYRRDACRSSLDTGNVAGSSQSIFSRFPIELVHAITTRLNYNDIQSLRLASKELHSKFSILPPIFWKSQFMPGGEFEYIFEARQLDPDAWEAAYFTAKRTTSGISTHTRCEHVSCAALTYIDLQVSQMSGLRPRRNHETRCEVIAKTLARRKIMWKVLQPLSDLMAQLGSHGPSPSPSGLYRPFSPGTATTIFPAKLVHGPQWLREGCRSMYQRSIRMPTSYTAVAVSTVRFDATQHVSGLQFLPDGPSIGYMIPNNTWRVECRADALRGFAVAVGERGLRALKILRDGGQAEWIPRCAADAHCEELRFAAAGGMLNAEFDAFKMVGIGFTDV